jgi:Protein of unknown function (DUF2946)
MIGWQRQRGVVLMRRLLRKYYPIVLMALTVQILAPIATFWAAAIAVSDPLHAAFSCHDNGISTQGAADNQDDQTGQPRAHHGCCSICSVAHAGAPIDSPQAAVVTTPYLQSKRVVWLDRAPDPFGSRTGSHAQARAPPSIS